ncbi:MAG: TIGR03790 family protein [Gemmataceae bacterium]
MNRWFLALVGGMLCTGALSALEPAQIIIIYNSTVPDSRSVAEHYQSRRKVPAENLIGLKLPDKAELSRVEYDALLAGPLREKLAGRKDGVHCLLTIYGVPWRVGPKEPSTAEKAAAAELQPKIDAAKAGGDVALQARLQSQQDILRHAESTAAVDSELTLLFAGDYALTKWRPNPRHWQFPVHQLAKMPRTLLTARLDGPTPAIAKRLVDDAILVEERGPEGSALVDARGIAFDPKAADSGTGYAAYDESMRETAKLFERARFTTKLDDLPTLLPNDSAKSAFLYTGWYALTDYRPVATFAPGAIAWHLASGEAVTLRDPKSRCWCPNLLAAGAAVTLGPVAEPYTIGFPKPAEFYGFLLSGEYTLAEVHARTQYFISWMTVLVGDPLYTPFRKNPRVKASEVIASPIGGRALFR